jgi:hypothetical protein
MGTKELRVGVKELNRLGVACAGCKSEHIFDAASDHGPRSASCPNCGVAMPHVIPLVNAYRDFFSICTSLESKVAITLLVRLDA